MWVKKLGYSVIAAVFLLSGCATIVGDPTQSVSIRSTPSESHISIKDETGVEVFSGATPTVVTLQKSNGHYWGGKHYVVTIDKAGFKTQMINLDAQANGWYLGGNLLFGGLIGWFIVDPLNGKMYTLSPGTINTSLPAQTASLNSKGGISVVLIDEVPQQLRAQMQLVHSN